MRLQIPPGAVEFLNILVLAITYINVAIPVKRYASGSNKLAIAGAIGSQRRQKRTRAVEFLHPAVKRISHVHVSIAVRCKAKGIGNSHGPDPKCPQVVINPPILSNLCTLWFSSSVTSTLPLPSTATPLGSQNCPLPLPRLSQDAVSAPVLSNILTLSFPSAT